MNNKGNLLNYKEIGIRIRLEREKLGLSREKFAEIVGLSSFYIGQIERGERRMSINTLANISNSLNSSLDYILNGHVFYMENITISESFDNLYKEGFDEELRELLSILRGCTKMQLSVIKDISKILLPTINR